MKRNLLIAATLLMVSVLQAQQEIKIEDLSKHTGDSVTICTKIYGGIYLDRSKGAPTFLNAGGAYPNAPLTIVIWNDTRQQFSAGPGGTEGLEMFYKDKEVCVTGRISLYKEKPQIVIYDPKQITAREK